MEIRYGASVFGIAGKRLGDVDGVVIDAGTKRVRSLIVDAGFLNQAKHMVPVSAIRSIDDEGIRLDTTGPRAAAQSPTIGQEEMAIPQRVSEPEMFIPAAGVGGPIIASDPSVPGEYPNDSSFFDMAPIDPPPVEVFSNLLDNEVLLEKRSEAYSADSHKVGRVAAFTLGDLGLVESVTVTEGRFSREQATFPLAEIEEFGTGAVHLRVDKDEAERR